MENIDPSYGKVCSLKLEDHGGRNLFLLLLDKIIFFKIIKLKRISDEKDKII